MAQAGFGKLTADDLVACKIQGVTPETIAEIKKQGLEINKRPRCHLLPHLRGHARVRLRHESRWLRQTSIPNNCSPCASRESHPNTPGNSNRNFPNVTADDLVKARIFNIDDEFIAQAAKHGFTNLPFEKLVQLRISGLLDDESVKK